MATLTKLGKSDKPPYRYQYEFGGVVGYGKTASDAKADCERRIAHLIQPPMIVSLHPYFVEEPNWEGGYEYYRTNHKGARVPGTTCYHGQRGMDKEFMLMRLAELEKESLTSVEV